LRHGIGPTPNPLYVEFDLTYVIARSQVVQPRADRRINAVENTLSLLTRPWRPPLPIAPADDLRMSSETAEMLIRWVMADDARPAHLPERLEKYTGGAVTDPAVPSGWIRVRLATDKRRE
jgi:hypothetical protein